jgi:hypothetical protein
MGIFALGGTRARMRTHANDANSNPNSNSNSNPNSNPNSNYNSNSNSNCVCERARDARVPITQGNAHTAKEERGFFRDTGRSLQTRH